MEKARIYKIEKNSSLRISKNDINYSRQSEMVLQPSSGAIQQANSSFVYTPQKDFTGTDIFTIKNDEQKKITVVIEVREIVFKPRARMLLQLGDQLIKDENIALLELVKNSYDADADRVIVLMENIDHKEKGIIQIEDNGTGMDLETVINVWMEPGSDFKAQKVRKNEVTKKYDRLPIGEKGIGRFGVHKLGNKVELYSKKEGKKEVHIQIDWTDFEAQRYLDNVPVKVKETDTPFHFTEGNTGTFIQVEGLRFPWNRRMARETYRALGSLKSPFTIDIYPDKKEKKQDFYHIKDIKKKDVFNVELEIDTHTGEDWLGDLPDFNEIAEYSLYNFYAEVDDDSISEFKYKFDPWDTIKEISGRHISHKDKVINHLLELERREEGKSKPVNFSIENKGIGKIKVRGIVFSLDNGLNRYGLQGKKKYISDYLRNNGGVRVFRDGLRIYNYGERDADWLGLDIKRVNSPGTKLSNNLIIVEVHIDRESSTKLVEKTNREGFVEDEVYEYFRDAVLHVLNAFAICWNTDKARLKEVIGISPKSEPVLAVIEDTKKYIENSLKEVNEKKRKKLLYNLARIEKDYKEINSIMQTAAGAGLNMSVIIHEIEKILKETRLVLEDDGASDRVISLVSHMQKLVEGYTTIIRRSGVKNISLKKTITDSLFNVSYRLKVHEVEVVKEYLNIKENVMVKAASNLLIGALLNIIDNSIYWLEKSGRKNQSIFLNIEKDRKYTHLIIADNGTGFTIPIDSITQPFVSGKINGMGLGLHITKEIITGMKADLIFPEWGDYNIPDDFKLGAVIVIRFKNLD